MQQTYYTPNIYAALAQKHTADCCAQVCVLLSVTCACNSFCRFKGSKCCRGRKSAWSTARHQICRFPCLFAHIFAHTAGQQQSCCVRPDSSTTINLLAGWCRARHQLHRRHWTKLWGSALGSESLQHMPVSRPSCCWQRAAVKKLNGCCRQL